MLSAMQWEVSGWLYYLLVVKPIPMPWQRPEWMDSDGQAVYNSSALCVLS